MTGITILLAGKEHPVKPLKLRQIRDIWKLIAAAVPDDPAESVALGFDRAVKIISLGLSDVENFSEDKLLDMEITRNEIDKASAAVLELSGFVMKKAAPAGEAEPAETPA